MRGEKMTEMLKQPQYQPQPMEDQVAVIFAATRGFVNDIPTARLQSWARVVHRLPAREAPARYPKRSPTATSFGRRQEALGAAIKEFNKSF